MKPNVAKKIAVILNGCGHRDGSEIHEAVLTLLAIEEEGCSWEVLAPDSKQAKVLNHVDGSTDLGASPRNMLKEAARIARGRVKSLGEALPTAYDAVILPGGSGTASNLCDFAEHGLSMKVDSMLVSFLEGCHSLKKPIGAICISPIILARVFGDRGVCLTLGDLAGDASNTAKAMGAKMRDCPVEQCFVDEDLRIVTTPAYMVEAGVSDIAKGIRMLVKEIIRLTA
jgi:enhancing lycopene biosynthesis protein 2